MAGIRILEGNPENLRELFQFSSRSFAAHLNIPSTDGVPSTDEAPFSFDAWEARYSQAGLIVYANGDSIAGFAFAHAKSVDHLHIWLALTNPSFQRQGIMRRIFTEIIETAKARGYKKVTVNTVPDKFPNMPKFLNSMGFSVYEENESKLCYELVL